jgi:pantetheine-phosphate adenylyltransferase
LTRALYAGSFDPLTRGHLDIIAKANATFDHVQIGIGVNQAKQGFFPMETRFRLIGQSLEECDLPDIQAAYADGRISIGHYSEVSIIRFAKATECTHIVRGLRQAGDFNDEFALAGVAGHLDSQVIFTHFICQEKFLHVSSSFARELASLDEDISWLVTPVVEEALKKEFEFRKLYKRTER